MDLHSFIYGAYPYLAGTIFLLGSLIRFEREQYTEIAAYASSQGVDWFASPWDVPSVEFLESMGVSTHKVASASVTSGCDR